MKITFVGHASALITFPGGKGLLMDPWYEGKVFNHGWALGSAPVKVPESAVDDLWISHEHPDHLHFPTLGKFGQDAKERIRVLHQKHSSPRVKDALRGPLGFQKLTELPVYEWVQIGEGREAYCGSVGSMDSFLAVRAGGQTILNLNDCVLNKSQLAYVKRQLGRVDVLLTQFSFANWVGNQEDERHEAARKRRQILLQNGVLAPGLIIPSASFVYFCNVENARMNAWANQPADIDRLGLPNLRFMYPGDEHVVGTEFPHGRSSAAVRKYQGDRENITIDGAPAAVELSEVADAARERLRDFRSRTGMAKRMEDLTILLKDLGQVLRVSFQRGEVMVEDPGPSLPVDMEMCGQAAHYLFKFPWGASTLQISGMFLDHRYARKGGHHPFFKQQNRLATEFVRVRDLGSLWRVAAFLWRKKWELFYRYADRFTGRFMVGGPHET